MDNKVCFGIRFRDVFMTSCILHKLWKRPIMMVMAMMDCYSQFQIGKMKQHSWYIRFLVDWHLVHNSSLISKCSSSRNHSLHSFFLRSQLFKWNQRVFGVGSLASHLVAVSVKSSVFQLDRTLNARLLTYSRQQHG